MGKYLVYDKDVSKFKDLLVSTKMLDARFLDQLTRDTIPNLKFVSSTESDYWTAFIPTNAAMTQALADGLIPTNADSLKAWLLYHFVRKKVIFDDGQLSGKFDSERVLSTTAAGTVYAPLTVTNDVNNLTIKDHSGKVVPIDHSKADILVRKGVVHKISSVLKY
jgi:uncharacterized surface protein with fasciclin (FAS1) repeats